VVKKTVFVWQHSVFKLNTDVITVNASIPIVQEAGWAQEPVWTCAKNLAPTGVRSPDRPARSQSIDWATRPTLTRGTKGKTGKAKKALTGELSRYSDSLRAGRSGDRIPVGARCFRNRPDRPCGPPSYLYNGYVVFPGGKAAGAWRWLPTPSSAEVEVRVELCICSFSGPSWPVLGWSCSYSCVRE
jgi:hypothetical protein